MAKEQFFRKLEDNKTHLSSNNKLLPNKTFANVISTKVFYLEYVTKHENRYYYLII